MSPLSLILLQAAILAYATVGGVFLAFSDFLMRSLARTSGAGGVEAMQVINREVFRWVFMSLFLGMAAASALLVVAASRLAGPGATLVGLAGLVYLVGSFGVTVVFNVPMNARLAAMEVSEPATDAYWTGTYLPRWTFWNSVRTVACALAAALLLVALTRIVQAPAA